MPPSPAREGIRTKPVKYHQWGEVLDHEAAMAYKNIREVIAAQKDLVTVPGEFIPRLAKLAPGGERPED